VPRIPLIDDLTDGQLPPGSNVMVEFDAASQWYNSCLTIAAGWVKTGGSIGYNGFTKAPEDVRLQLTRLGLGVGELEGNDRLRVYDWYTPTLGKKSKEKYGIDSLKVADQSILFRLTEDDLKDADSEWPESLRIVDNFSALARFNDERSWVEFMLTRVYPIGPVRKSTLVFGIMKGVLSEWAVRQLEGSADGIIDFKLEETGGKIRDLMQIRIMRNVHFNRQPTELTVGQNFEIAVNT
jgi:KaiC/GvpD/RAD55 family RecA-like ATPase